MAEDDGFLSRWSRRKVQVRQGGAQPAEPLPALEPRPAPVSATELVVHDDTPRKDAGLPPAQPHVPAPPAPTLSDVATLTHESDFARFVTPEVPGEVRNAALKKLFSDPHFNVMDGLDTYIDDYNKPDPLPAAMLRQMTQAAYLGLVEPEPEQAVAQAGIPPPMALAPVAQECPNPFSSQSPNECAPGDVPVAMSPAAAPEAAVMKPHDEDPDLRLQSLHDPGPPGPEPGLGGHAGGQR